METIIEEQEKEFLSKFTTNGDMWLDWLKIDYETTEYTPGDVYDWHKNSIKQILQVLVEREKVELNIIFKNDNNTKYEEGYKDKIKDTIQYLQEQIKKL